MFMFVDGFFSGHQSVALKPPLELLYFSSSIFGTKFVMRSDVGQLLQFFLFFFKSQLEINF